MPQLRSENTKCSREQLNVGEGALAAPVGKVWEKDGKEQSLGDLLTVRVHQLLGS